MRFYRSFIRPAAISFDLDDTLYDNRQVIHTTVEKTHQALQSWHPALQFITIEQYQAVRCQVGLQQPELVDDATALRQATTQQVMRQAGLNPHQVEQGTEQVMTVFRQWRSAIAIPATTHRTLALLAAQMPLVGITNGNADPRLLGIEAYFQFILRAGPDGKAKPAVDLYTLAAEQLALPPQRILHVGDDLETDIRGALAAGYQSCWINDRQQNLMSARSARLVPHVEISQLDSLASLL